MQDKGTLPKPANGRKRVVIEGVAPEIDSGRFPIKRIVGDSVVVEADVFGDGHDHVYARLLYKPEGADEWQSVSMTALGNDRWRGEFPVTEIGRYVYSIAGGEDHFETWQTDLVKRITAGQEVSVELQNGGLILRHIAALASGKDAAQLSVWASLLLERHEVETTKSLAVQPELLEVVRRYPDLALELVYDRELVVIVDREKARFSSWYEFFPRSQGAAVDVHGTFADCEARLPYVAELGFDVLYFPPIHPIGTAFRKGKTIP